MNDTFKRWYAVHEVNWLGKWAIGKAGEPTDRAVECRSRVDAAYIVAALNMLTGEQQSQARDASLAACRTDPPRCVCGKSRPCPPMQACRWGEPEETKNVA